MIFIIGGVASGKRTFAHALGASADDIVAADDLFRTMATGEGTSAAPAVPAAESVPRRFGRTVVGVEDALRPGASAAALDPERIARALAAEEIVICCEVGAGVVPLDPAEAAWRERVGRTCEALAAHASCVVRMVCGIPQVLKGTLPQR